MEQNTNQQRPQPGSQFGPQFGPQSYPPPYPPNYVWQPPKQSNKALWIALACVAVVIIIVLAFSGSPPATDSYAALQGPSVAVVYVEGTISSSGSASYGSAYDHQYLLNTISALTYDDDNRGILLYIDSPGGEVLATSELTEALSEYRKLTKRPIYAYGHNYAASGGYWLACAADKIYLNRYCTTGSIGVTYGTMLDISGLLEKYGIRTTTIASGGQKGMGSMYEEMGEETIAIYQEIIDEYFGYFVDWVSQRRDLPMERLLPLADGRIYTAKQAVGKGLADMVGDYDTCLRHFLSQIDDDCTVLEYYPTYEYTLLDRLLYSNAEDSELTALLQLAPPRGVLAYYEQ